MDTLQPPMNPEVTRLRRISAQRKYRQRLRYVRLLWLVAGVLLFLLVIETIAALCFSPRFWVYRIETSGQETLSKGEIIRLVGLRAEGNFYRTSPVRLAERVRAHPRIKSAVVQRGKVGVLTVTVRERQPVCRIGTGRSLLYVDGNGVAFTRPVAPKPQVPLIEGIAVPSAAKVNGHRLANARVTVALSCLAAMHDTAPDDTTLAISRVRFEAETGYLTLVLPQGTQIYMGRPRDLPAKAWVVHRIIARAHAKGQSLSQIEYIDVQVIAQPTDVGAVIKLKRAQEAATP